MRVRRVWSRDAGDISAALAETLKYATKGSDLADETKARSASAIIDQIDRCRMVTSFGSCFGLPEFKRTRAAPAMCGCGCSDWLPETVMAETEFRAARKRR